MVVTRDPDSDWVNVGTYRVQRAIFEFICADMPLGRPYLAPPQLPPEQITLLRKAFAATMKDPEFLADAQRLNIDVSPTSGEELDRLVKKIAATPPEIVELAKQLIARQP